MLLLNYVNAGFCPTNSLVATAAQLNKELTPILKLFLRKIKSEQTDCGAIKLLSAGQHKESQMSQSTKG